MVKSVRHDQKRDTLFCRYYLQVVNSTPTEVLLTARGDSAFVYNARITLCYSTVLRISNKQLTLDTSIYFPIARKDKRMLKGENQQ